jgi:hypothetical protein
LLKDTQCFAVITLVAQGERFNALAILATPAFFDLAIVFNVRTSCFDHARRTTTQQGRLAMRRCSSVI